MTLDGRPLHMLRVADLKAALEQRGLAKSGQKSALVKRLRGVRRRRREAARGAARMRPGSPPPQPAGVGGPGAAGGGKCACAAGRGAPPENEGVQGWEGVGPSAHARGSQGWGDRPGPVGPRGRGVLKVLLGTGGFIELGAVACRMHGGLEKAAGV